MLTHPAIDPVAIEIGPLQVRWYGLMYLVGFALAWWLLRRHARRRALDWGHEQIDDLVFWGAVGTIAGGRIGYLLFYQFQAWLQDPLLLVRVWEGGMSFHGGLLGVIAAMAWYGRRHGRSLFAVTDFIAPVVPLGFGAGRLGNFINGELWGRVTDVPWGMVFPGAGPLPRHPSQLYELALEGIALFVLLWWFSARPRPLGAVSGLFLLAYGSFRFGVEFLRAPDPHLGTIAFDWLTMGQLLSLPMIVGGAALLAWSYRNGGR
ncbi:MAG: prolipoprotein diacylglyceryl transferase [Halofilum sp. (in: g-proteobacteria)]|nr:prolipoprotein diacylglyceryl transferase [Halofilum sp. (in: g-proteobacteria)]